MSKPRKVFGSCERISLFAFFILLATPACLIGWLGIGRSYFSIPDQDLLWLSEGMRLVRGVAPSYADHPGAIWSLISSFNLSYLLRSVDPGSTFVFDPNQLLPEAIAEKSVFLMRIQNALVVSAIPILFYVLALQYRIRKTIAAVSAFTFSCSTALLVAVSEVRHEAMSLLFFGLFLIAVNSLVEAAFCGPSAWRRVLLVALALASFFLLCFSKQQALCLFPFAILSGAWMYRMGCEKQDCSSLNLPVSIRRIRFWFSGQMFPALIVGSSAVWILCALPDLDLINLPFWVVINFFLSLMVFLSAGGGLAFGNAVGFSFLSILVSQLVVFRVLSPGWWRQAVTGFPSWMFQYANETDNKVSHSFSGFKNYLGDFFLNPGFGFWLVLILTFAAVVSLLLRFKTFGSIFSSGLSGWLFLDSAWIFSILVAIAFTQRFAVRYEVYFYAPLLMLSALRLESFCAAFQVSGFAGKRLKCNLLALGYALFLVLLLFKSISNLSRLSAFVNTGQPSEFLCFGHHMDRSMSLTAAGGCPNFEEAKKSKDSYDSWWGPN